tara:strand:+ start:621 stop:2069 length:1449 start_codon:yes stop_codon:yes gene_type:complete
MFKDLKEYQEITQIYNDSVNISEEQRAINKIFAEEGFTLEEIQYLEENFDELWENELAQFTQECVSESFEEQDLTEEQIQQIDEVLGLKMLAKGITKAAPIASKGLRKMNVGIKKGLKSVGKKIGAVGTGVKDTAKGALSVGKSALKKVGGAIKKAAPIIGKGALLGTGAALPIAGAVGVVKGINALRKRGKKEREAGEAGKKAALDAKIKKGIKDSGMKSGQGTGMTMKGIKQASYNRGERAAREKLGDPTLNSNMKKKADPAKATETKPDLPKETKTKRMSKIEFQNRKRFGDKYVDDKKAMNAAFQKTKNKKSGYSKQDFIKDYPKSQTAKKYYQSDKAYRDYRKGLKKEDIEYLDAYDMVLEYLFTTEQVASLEEANYVMMEMDQQTIGEIVKEVKSELNELMLLELKPGKAGSAAADSVKGLAGGAAADAVKGLADKKIDKKIGRPKPTQPKMPYGGGGRPHGKRPPMGTPARQPMR